MKKREKQQELKRQAGFVNKRLRELNLHKTLDGRHAWRGIDFSLQSILGAVIFGMMAGRKGFAEIETLLKDSSEALRLILHLKTKATPADNTLRAALIKQDIHEIRSVLHSAVRAADRRKALRPAPGTLSSGHLAMDGKVTAISAWDDKFVQKKTPDDVGEGNWPYGLARTFTSCLTTAPGTPCIDVSPIPEDSNEVGSFGAAFEVVNKRFGHLFKYLSYDAGGASVENATLVHTAGKRYVFAIKDERWDIVQKTISFFSTKTQPAFEQREVASKGLVRVRRIYLGATNNGLGEWYHARTVIKVTSHTERYGVHQNDEYCRYFISNEFAIALKPEKWLWLIRAHWSVENNCHNTFDKIFEEDNRPFFRENCNGFYIALILRRIAYNFLTWFRSVTLKSETSRATPWKALCDSLLKWSHVELPDETILSLGLRSPSIA